MSETATARCIAAIVADKGIHQSIFSVSSDPDTRPQAQAKGYMPEVILARRRLNDSMAHFLAEQTVADLQGGLRGSSALYSIWCDQYT